MVTEGNRVPGFADRELVHDGARLRYSAGGPRLPRASESSRRGSSASPTTLPASAPAVVLVHGLGGTIENWRGLAPALARNHRVLVPDLPGHGRSAALPEAALLDDFADAVFAMAEAEGIGGAVWIGHSLGGTVALRAAVRRPDAVRGVVLAAAAGIGSSTRLGRITVTLLGLVQPGKAIARHRRAWASSRRGRRVAFGWWGVGDADALEPEMAEAFFIGPAFHTNTRQGGRALLATDPLDGLDRIACPVLVLWGASDRWVKLGDGVEYARRLGAPLRTIAGCGHLLIGERPEICLAAIEEFVASL
jgi:pimeloyl-ACP methyl ester carboxylesterase